MSSVMFRQVPYDVFSHEQGICTICGNCLKERSPHSSGFFDDERAQPLLACHEVSTANSVWSKIRSCGFGMGFAGNKEKPICHTFHFDCLRNSLDVEKVCPTCRLPDANDSVFHGGFLPPSRKSLKAGAVKALVVATATAGIIAGAGIIAREGVTIGRPAVAMAAGVIAAEVVAVGGSVTAAAKRRRWVAREKEHEKLSETSDAVSAAFLAAMTAEIGEEEVTALGERMGGKEETKEEIEKIINDIKETVERIAGVEKAEEIVKLFRNIKKEGGSEQRALVAKEEAEIEEKVMGAVARGETLVAMALVTLLTAARAETLGNMGTVMVLAAILIAGRREIPWEKLFKRVVGVLLLRVVPATFFVLIFILNVCERMIRALVDTLFGGREDIREQQ